MKVLAYLWAQLVIATARARLFFAREAIAGLATKPTDRSTRLADLMLHAADLEWQIHHLQARRSHA